MRAWWLAAMQGNQSGDSMEDYMVGMQQQELRAR
jgi:hypothetical protein